MLQRNTSGYPIELPTLGLGRLIHPGEDFDHEERLAGFTPVEELEERDAAGGEPDTENTTEHNNSDTTTSGNTQASGAQPVGHATDLPVDGADAPVVEPAPVTTQQAPAVLPFATEEA